MTLQELQSKVKVGDFVELFWIKGGQKHFAGYVTELYANAMVLVHEGIITSRNKDGEWINEFIQGKSISTEFNAGMYLANWYPKNL